MEVTISIINYNYGRYLSQAIESALNQNTKIDYEVLLIDDGSTDESDEVANKYTHHKKFRVSKSINQGFGKSLTRAIEEAKGKYVFLLDADDFFELNKLSCVFPVLQQGFLYVSDTPQLVHENGEKTKIGISGSTSTVAVNKAAALALMPIENEIYLFTLFKLGRGKILNKIITNYRYHSNSMTNRNEPGKWQLYLGKVTHNLANKLHLISNNNIPSIWNATKKDVIKTMYFFKSQAYYNEMEAYLELNQRKLAIKKYELMLISALRYKKAITLFHLKMLLKLILLRPSFPKN